MIGIQEIRNYIRHRWVDKTHCLTSNLERGQWHEFDERILHCLFDELVRFVEDEVGMKGLEWQSKLTGKDWDLDEDDSRYNQPAPQALNAREIIELYRWWKEIRPNRKNPWDEEKPLESVRMENEQEDEDTEMLVRLVKIRGALWT